jgi:hypothetical protein
MKARKLVVTVVALAAISVGQTVRADPIDLSALVTSGQYAVRSGVDTFQLIGEIGELVQDSGASPPKVFAGTCTACQAGDVVDLTFRNPPFDCRWVHPVRRAWHRPRDHRRRDAPVCLLQRIAEVQRRARCIPRHHPPRWCRSRPHFRLEAGSGRHLSLDRTQADLNSGCAGGGTASTSFLRDGDVFRPSGDTTFQFGSVTAEPSGVTPEPSSMLLLGTGLAALGRSAFRRVRR